MSERSFLKNFCTSTVVALVFLLQEQSYPQQQDTITAREGLALQFPRGYAETIIAPNPIEANLASGKWKAPKSSESVTFVNGEKHEWRTITADENGWFSDSVLNSCYVYLRIPMNQRSVKILESMGNEMAYVNGSPRSGNPYGLKEKWESWEPHFDYSCLPVILERGNNDFLFRCSRGRLKVKLYQPRLPVMFNPKDVTVPDFIVGEKTDTWGAIVIVNASLKSLKDLLVQTSIGQNEGEAIQVPIIQPLSVRKVAFRLNCGALTEKGTTSVRISLLRKSRDRTDVLDTVSIPFRVVNPQENHKETFISSIDGSVQYYGINPASEYGKEKPAALFLSLHGASVEAINQSGSYYPKTWGHIVAPTNRRPYGFNWEEWGRLDALEAMDAVKKRYAIDENRIYLTGHSMGGHGTWHIGSLFPDQFAAIGPSAGWISFWTYRFRGLNLVDTSKVRKMIRRSTTPSETYLHLENYKQMGVYVLHGSDDDNVPVDQARSMVEQLSKIHKDFVYHEQKGARHWWDNSDEPGTDCVDWAPMFDFFARHARSGKERIREINFLTSNPGVSAKNNWIAIDAQVEQLKMSSVDIRFDPGLRRFVGSTKNVARLAFDLDIIETAGSITVELDSQKVSNIQWSPEQKQLWLEQENGKWYIGKEPSDTLKGSHRYGTLKEAFRNRMIFVYGTKGTREENQWTFDKARHDAEKLWYQGNGSIDVVPDVEFDPSKEPDRSVIIYGNRNTNAAWNKLLSQSPVQVGDGFIRIRERKISGDDLSCFFVRPRTGSRTASVAVISGTGIVGMKINNRLPYLNPGIGLPDCTILNLEVLTKGEEGVIMTGFFGLDWSVERGEFVWGNQ